MDLAEDINVCANSIRLSIKNNDITSYKVNGNLYIDDEDADYLTNMFTLPKLTDFAPSDHKRTKTLTKMCSSGRLNSVKFMGQWRLYMDSVEVVKRICNNYSLSEIAESTGINGRAIYKMTKNGYLDAERLGGMNYYNNESYEKLKEYKNAVTKKGYMKIHSVNLDSIDYLIESGQIETFKFGKRLMIKDC